MWPRLQILVEAWQRTLNTRGFLSLERRREVTHVVFSIEEALA